MNEENTGTEFMHVHSDVIDKVNETMPEEEKRKIHIRPLCRNVGMMIATSGIIFLLSGAWYAFRKSGFLWCMVGWMVLSGADVYWIGKSGRFQSSGK